MEKTSLSKLERALETIFGEKLLEKAHKIDAENSAQGVELRGNEEVSGVALGVSVSIALFRKAKSAGCNTVITHHGLRVGKWGSSIEAGTKNRIAYLINNKMNLLAYHFPLDVHEEIGNNVQIMKALRIVPKDLVQDWYWLGEYSGPKSFKEVKTDCKEVFDRSPLASFNYGPEKIRRVAVCSGGGAPSPYEQLTTVFQTQKIDLFITGDPKEGIEQLCKELKLNFLAYGHYVTETFGVKALEKKIEQRFPKLPVEFIEVYDRF